MTWTYSGNPASSTLDQVRFLSGDTDSTNPLLSNEEFNFLISQWSPNTYWAAAFGCEAIAGKYQAQSDVSRSVGDLSLTTKNTEASKGFMERAHHLRDAASRLSPPSPNWDENGYPVSSEFKIGMDRNLGTGYTMPPVQFFPE
jgi:hypothetical protein